MKTLRSGLCGFKHVCASQICENSRCCRAGKGWSVTAPRQRAGGRARWVLSSCSKLPQHCCSNSYVDLVARKHLDYHLHIRFIEKKKKRKKPNTHASGHKRFLNESFFLKQGFAMCYITKTSLITSVENTECLRSQLCRSPQGRVCAKSC